MRISLRAEKAIQWLKDNEHPEGGIRAWSGHKAYPEVSGYLIPTLLDYGEKELAKRIADWLVSIQHKDGSFDGLDGIPRTFDTGAIMEGLYRIGYTAQADKAKAWIDSQRNQYGCLKSQHDSDTHNFYNVRVEGLLKTKELPAYKWFEGGKQRTHYLAYGFEGMLNLGYDITEELNKLPASGIMPAYVDENWKPVSGTDTTATAQIAILRIKSGLPFDPTALYALQMDNGGLPHDTGDNRQISWAVKYFLDMERLIDGN